MKEIRKIVKKELSKIFESRFKQDDLYNFSTKITKDIVDDLSGYIERYKDRLYDGTTWSFTVPELATDKIQEKTLIKQVIISIEYTHSPEHKISGSFKRVQLLDDRTHYRAILEMKIKIDDNIQNHFEEVEYFISHELHHAFRHIKMINKDSKMNKMNIAKNEIKFINLKILKTNPALKRFMDMIYYSLPQEVDARVQETAAQLKNDKNSKTPEETFYYLRQFNPMNDAKNMLSYDIEDISTVDDDILNQFIKSFNDELIQNNLNNYVKNEKKSFLNYWDKNIFHAGHKLMTKINKMIADKYKIEENQFIRKVDFDLLKESYGIE